MSPIVTKKQVIVVVHGVGVRDAGVSTDFVSAALAEKLDPIPPAPASPPQPQPQPQPQTHFVAHSSDDFVLLEDPSFGSGGRGGRVPFPARQRRFRAYGAPRPDGSRPVEKERVVTDFYWGDVSGTGTGPVRVLLGLFKIVLGLAHAIRENAEEVFPVQGRGARPWNARFRWVANWAVLLFHGPIVALNIALIGGLLVMAGITRMPVGFVQALGLSTPVGQAAVLAAILFAGGVWRARHGGSFLVRHLAGWTAAVAVLLFVWAVLMPVRPFGTSRPPISAFDQSLIDMSCGNGAANEACADAYAGLFLLGLRLWGLLGVLWIVVTAAALLLCAVEWWRRKEAEARGVKPFTGPALGLVLLLWVILIGAIWASLKPFVVPAGTTGTSVPFLTAAQFDTLVGNALRPVLGAGTFLILLLVVAGALHRRKAKAAPILAPAAYLADADATAERHRLIVGRWLLWTLAGFLVAHAALTALIYTDLCDGACGGLKQRIRDWTVPTLAVLAVLGAAAVGTFARQLAAGVAIFTDILSYLNDADWNSHFHAEPPSPTSARLRRTRTWFERVPFLRPVDKGLASPRGYWKRDRIRARLERLVERVIEDEDPDEMVFVTHSQGTVIAIDVLDRQAGTWNGPRRRIGLVTMGSPYSHLYNRYFPSQFPPHRDRDGVRPGGPLAFWINIFRTDDFVGTHVDLARNHRGVAPPQVQWPVEMAIAKGGHTNYWTDLQVARRLQELLAF